MTRALAALAVAACLAVPARAQAPPAGGERPGSEVADLVNALLGALMGSTEVTGERLQAEVAEAGGIPFRRDVPVAFLGRAELAVYLRELIDSEYPAGRARADERLLTAFDLLPPRTDLRALRGRLLEENVAGFYDERPDRRRLYAVSEDRSFTPMNQIVLAHELRHALQDQYRDLHGQLGDDVTDFDDRRLAWMSLLEGDATLVMERFVKLRLGLPGGEDAGAAGGMDAAGMGAPGLYDLPDAPPVIRDHLMQPYLAGLVLARAIWSRGGASAMQDAWSRPPVSMEQVLHPERYFAAEPARRVTPALAPPPGAWLLCEGTLGELLLRTLLEPGGERAAEGWGGDGFRLYDAGSRTLLAWRSEWDSPADAREFSEALRARFARKASREPARNGFELFRNASGWLFAIRSQADAVELVSGDDPVVVVRALAAAAHP
ncbi:MAG TPA: hypothetical protein VIJ10_10895 [Vicinamibacteria bacterium]